MRIGVYGLGRFGSLWASLLSRQHEVLAYNRSPERPTPEGVRRVEREELGSCDGVFLCTAISAVEATCRDLLPVLRPKQVVLDTCSVKSYPLETMDRILPETLETVGTHPMFGPDSVSDGYGGLPTVISPGRCTSKTVETWRTLLEGLGLRVIPMSAEAHDREAAYTQGITHFVGRLLDSLNVRPSSIATLGYQKILEVVEQTCNDPYQLFVDLQRYNPYTSRMRRDLRAGFDQLLSELDSATPDE
ncbi:MAG: prephenate dehydrogenase/arogenate dehydrogenase family protein [Spirochaetaceae bacterium]